MPGQVTAIAKAIEAGLSLWKTFIATRQQAYNRQMDKNKRYAIDAAEEYIHLDDKLAHTIGDKKIAVIVKQKKKWRKRFFKYNN